MMGKYAQLKKFHHDWRLQVYMYTFMYVDPKTTPVEDHFTATKTFVIDYKKISTPVTAPEYWLRFSYTRSKYYELDQSFDDTELKKQDHTSNDKVKNPR